jgi:hypothetical protein
MHKQVVDIGIARCTDLTSAETSLGMHDLQGHQGQSASETSSTLPSTTERLRETSTAIGYEGNCTDFDR